MASIYESFTENLNERAPHFKNRTDQLYVKLLASYFTASLF